MPSVAVPVDGRCDGHLSLSTVSRRKINFIKAE